MKLIGNSKAFPSKAAPFGMQQSGGAQNRPPLIYPDDMFSWPDLNKPLTTAVRIENNALAAEKSKLSPEGVTAAGITGVEITSDEPKLNAIYVEYTKDFTIKDCKIDIAGVGEDDFAGIGSGVMVNRDSDVVLENLDIHTAGAGRSCTTSTGGSNVIIRNCRLVTEGGPLPEDYVPKIGMGMLEPPPGLEIGGSSRAHLSMDHSKTYIYDTTVEAAGWAALSTDACNDYVYLEANNCDLTVKDKGYGIYVDGDCHAFLNNCRINAATHASILAEECDLTLNNCTAVAGKYLTMVHAIYQATGEVSQLTVHGGSYETGIESLLLRSCNTYVDLVGTQIKSKSGVLVRAIKNPDDHATVVGEDEIVYGNNIVMSYMNAEGDLLNEDPERSMKITLTCTNLKGGIDKAYIMLDAASLWTATKDSTVVLTGDCRISQFDALEGVTITAEAGEGCPLAGEYVLASGGKLVVC